MAVGPFAQPATPSGENGQPLVPPPQKQQGLPIESIAQSAQRFQKRRNAVKDELDQAMLSMAKQTALPQNQQAFQSLISPIRQRISEIAESGDLINKQEEIRNLSQAFARRQQAFKTNRENYTKSLENIRSNDTLTPKQRQAWEQRITEQARIGVGPSGQVQPGLQAPEDLADLKTPHQVLDELSLQDKKKILGVSRNSDGTITKDTFRGVSKRRAQQAALNRLGYTMKNGQVQRADNAPTNPGLQRWRQVEREKIQRMSDKELSPEEVEKRVNDSLMHAVKGAVTRLEAGGRSRTTKSDPGASGSGSEEGTAYMTQERIVGGDLVNGMPDGTSPQTKQQLKASKAAAREAFWKNYKGAMSRQEYQRAKSIANGTAAETQKAVGPMSPGPLGSGASTKQEINRAFGKQGAFREYEKIRDQLEAQTAQSISQNSIKFNDSSTYTDLEATTSASMPRGEQVSIPAIDRGAGGVDDDVTSLPFIESGAGYIADDKAEEKNHVVANSRPLALMANQEMVKMQYTGKTEDSDVMTEGQTYVMEATPQMVEGFKQHLPDQMVQTLEMNQSVQKTIGQDWTSISGAEDVQLKIDPERNGRTATYEPRYAVKSEDKELTYMDAINAAFQGKNKKQTMGLLQRVAEQANLNNVPLGRADVRRLAERGPEALDQESQRILSSERMKFENKGPAARWGQLFNPNNQE